MSMYIVDDILDDLSVVGGASVAASGCGSASVLSRASISSRHTTTTLQYGGRSCTSLATSVSTTGGGGCGSSRGLVSHEIVRNMGHPQPHPHQEPQHLSYLQEQ